MVRSRFLFRSVVALLLMIGFYVLALGIAGGCFYLSYIVITDPERESGSIVYVLIFGLTILWSVFPRRDKFAAPGPQIFESDQPELWNVVRDVAAAAKQAMPDEIYVLGDANAWVAHRGGMMGVGTRRVMGLGLPLLQTLTLPQFRAVLAHEFGHYAAGDTALAPIIYKTREAIGRTIDNLARNAGFLHKPFLWYGNLYLRVTQAISRAQELNADVLSAQVAGARNAAAALESVHRTSLAFDGYWANEVVPLLNRGFRPPIAAGFARFVAISWVGDAMKETVDRELREGKGHAHDSHPPLRERIRALKAMRGGTVDENAPLVWSILRDADALERGILTALDEKASAALKPIAWEETPQVMVTAWREYVKPHETGLRGIVPEEFARMAGSMPSFAARLQLKDVAPAERTETAVTVLACAFATSLHEQGWTCVRGPGEPIVMVRGEHTIQPFDVLPKLMRGELATEAWTAQCRAAGIERLPLGS